MITSLHILYEDQIVNSPRKQSSCSCIVVNLQFKEDPDVLEDKLNDPRLTHGSPILTQIASVLCIDTSTNEKVSSSKGKKSKLAVEEHDDSDDEVAPAPKKKGNQNVKEVSHCCCVTSCFAHPTHIIT